MLKFFTIGIFICLIAQTFGNNTFLGNHIRYLETASDEILIPGSKTNVKCFWVNNFSVYNLNGLKQKEDITVSFDLLDSPTTASITYNFCKNLEGYPATIIATQRGFGRINLLSGDLFADQNGYKISEWIENNIFIGLRLRYAPGEVCGSGLTGQYYQTNIDLVCDPNDTSDGPLILTIDKNKNNMNACVFNFIALTKKGCTLVNFYLVSSFLDKYKWPSTAIICGLGFFLCFFGTYFIKATMFIVCTFGVPFVTLFIFLSFTNPSGDWVVWLILGLGLPVGVGVGFLVNKFFQFFAGILGGFLGYVAGMLIYNMILQYIPVGASWAYWLTVIASIVLFAVLAFYFVKIIVIVSTSVIGGYMIVRGSSLILEGFPNESQVLDLINEKEWEQLAELVSGIVYIYLGVFGGLALGGTFLQWFFSREKEDKDYRYIEITTV